MLCHTERCISSPRTTYAHGAHMPTDADESLFGVANEAHHAGGFAFWPMPALLTADATPGQRGHGAEGGRLHACLLGGTPGAAEDCGRNLFTSLAFGFATALAARAADGDLDFVL